MTDRLKKQIEFIIEIDKIKNIVRRTKLFDGSKLENDAEHSWHLAVMALILMEHANDNIDILKVMKMVLIHDIVEIDAGDYSAYTNNTAEKEEKELAAASRIFGILPEDQKLEFTNLWKEFEGRTTPEARFASAIDRLEPVMQNYFTEAYAWKNNSIKSEQILNVNKRIENGSEVLWQYAKRLIEECVEKKLIE